MFRFILAIYSLCMSIISAGVILIAFSQDMFNRTSEFYKNNIRFNSYSVLITVFIAVVFFALSLGFLLSALKTGKDRNAVSNHTNTGEIKITLKSIEIIALTVARRIDGVKDIRAFVKNVDNNVLIKMMITVMPDVKIPEITAEVQMKVKEVVEEHAGVKVNEVKVVVDNIYAGTVSNTYLTDDNKHTAVDNKKLYPVSKPITEEPADKGE